MFSKTAEYTFFSSAHATFSSVDNTLDHETSLRKFKRMEIMQRMVFGHNGRRLKINNQRICEKYTDMWKLNDTLLNNHWIKEKISQEK